MKVKSDKKFANISGIKTPWPTSFFPQMAVLVSRLPEGDKWISEIKLDGYRLIAFINNGNVVLRTRRGQNWTEHFESIAQVLTRLPVENAILDGEVVVMNPDGTTNFQKLQNIMHNNNKESLVYYVFDLPYFQGRDLTRVPLIERKNLLHDLIETYHKQMPSIRYTEHLEFSGERVLRSACQYQAEGIIAKRADSSYVQKRTRSWVKKKCHSRQEFVVGGFTRSKDSTSFFGSLVLGYYDDKGRLVYCGHVGTGFDSKSIATIYERLKKLRQSESPFATSLEAIRNSGYHWTQNSREYYWIKPILIAEVEFSGWTDDRVIRHPSFKGIREDKYPQEITIEETMPH